MRFVRYSRNGNERLAIVTGTPPGVGHARRPQLWIKVGDVVEVEVDEIGILGNPVRDA